MKKSRFDTWWDSLDSVQKFFIETDENYSGHDHTHENQMNAFYEAINRGEA